MRTVSVAACMPSLLTASAALEAAPFEGLDEAPGVYVTVDGHGITIRHSAVDWSFYLPDGSKAEWKKSGGDGSAPHVKITCRAEGGYSPAAAPRAVWTIPRPNGTPKGLGRRQRARWNRLWPWTFGDSIWDGNPDDAVDLGLSAIVDGKGVVLSRRLGGTKFTVRIWFLVDADTAAAARQLATHCVSAR